MILRKKKNPLKRPNNLFYSGGFSVIINTSYSVLSLTNYGFAATQDIAFLN